MRRRTCHVPASGRWPLRGLFVSSPTGAYGRSSNVRRNERGDVPGWVLIIVMTAGLATIVYLSAYDQIAHWLRTTLS
jgi:hypothetical protein